MVLGGEMEYESAAPRPWRPASCAPVLQQGRRAFQVIDDPVRPSVVSFSMLKVGMMAPVVDSCSAPMVERLALNHYVTADASS